LYEVALKCTVGFGPLPLYKFSLIKALATVYPDHPWDIHKFGKLPQRYWQDEKNIRQFLDKVAIQLGVRGILVIDS
jgi:hypothetical protein